MEHNGYAVGLRHSPDNASHIVKGASFQVRGEGAKYDWSAFFLAHVEDGAGVKVTHKIKGGDGVM
jgi:hypothetical protein